MTLRGSSYRGARLDEFEREAAPRLEQVGDGRDGRGVDEAARQLLGLPDRRGPAGRIALVDEAQVDLAHVRRVVVQQADEPERRHELDVELLGPLSAERTGQVAVEGTVAGVDVAAHADRITIVEPSVAAGARSAHEEPARAVTQ